MNQTRSTTSSSISEKAIIAAAAQLGCDISDIQIVDVGGGYSRNRRSLVGCGDKWIFAKEVDLDLLPDDGELELGWLRKDYECTKLLRQIVPEFIPDWGELAADGHVYLMTSYRAEDGWSWTMPSDLDQRPKYIQAVVDATKKLELIKFDKDTIDELNFHPYFRDKIALDNGFRLIIQNEEIRNELLAKYDAMLQDESIVNLHSIIHKMLELLKDKKALSELADKAASLINQPNNYFGHCDVRSDNIAYNHLTGQIKIVDWNWASFTPKGFGATEFLIDMVRRGADVSAWIDCLNIEALAAICGSYLRRCLDDPLTEGCTLRSMQAQSAAIAFKLYVDCISSK